MLGSAARSWEVAMSLVGVVFDALDVEALARFWAGAVNGTRIDRAVVRAGDGGVRLRFVPASRPKTRKNRLHLDLGGGPRPDREVDRLLALGAARADIGQGAVPWTVLADPEGNEFCVLPEESAGGQPVAICLDAADPRTQGRFWGTALGWPIVDQGGWGVSLRSPAATGPRLVMGPPVAAKTGRNRLLLEIASGGEALGMEPGASETGTEMADPEGNEFVLWPPVDGLSRESC
jgi:hypothetical protein